MDKFVIKTKRVKEDSACSSNSEKVYKQQTIHSLKVCDEIIRHK